MAKKLKDYYNKSCATLIAQKLSAASPSFNSEAFVNEITVGIKGKEFLARQDVFASSLEKYLSKNYSKNLKTLHKILGPELQTHTGMFIHGYWLWPVGRYIERQGPQNPEQLPQTLEFIYELTKRFTGEFAIRPLLRIKPQETLKEILLWSSDPNVHVRRLASESIRVRLPWATKLNVFYEHLGPCSKILSNLKEAPEKFVQKSVGNNLNDLFKERADIAQKIIKSWQTKDLNKHTAWIIKHGTRALR